MEFRDNDYNKFCDHCSERDRSKLKVFGKGTVSVKPDAAEVIIGVITENVQLEVAQEDNARITTQVINSLVEVGVLPQNMQTINYNIRVNYDYINGKQVFRGYEVNNTLKILIKNINSVGEIVDTAVRNGANIVSGITFIVTEEIKYYYEALRLAIKDAQNKASIMANELNVKINIVPVQINEQGRDISTPLPVMTFKAASVSTPIEAGENEIVANIEAFFLYSE